MAVKKEFGLLSYMEQNVNRVVSVDALFECTWEMVSMEDTRTIAVHIKLTPPILRRLLRFGGQAICWLPEVRCKRKLKVFFTI